MTIKNLPLPLLCLALNAAAVLGCGSIDPSDEGITDDAEFRLGDGVVVDDDEFEPVVRIDNGLGRCTATAVSHDLLLTAAHCVMDPDTDSLVSYVEVVVATGANADADGARSSYIVLAEQALEYNYEWYDNDSPERDIVLIKYPADTFTTWYEIGQAEEDPSEKYPAVAVGFADSNTKRMDDEHEHWGAPDTDWKFLVPGLHTELGDSGGPILEPLDGGGYEVIGVVSESHIWGGDSYSTQAVNFHWRFQTAVTAVEQHMDRQCIELYHWVDQGGHGYSICDETDIDDALNWGFFLDTIRKGGDMGLENQASSLAMPDSSVVTLYAKANQAGSSVTFQNVLSFGSTSKVDALSLYDMNNKASSYSWYRATGEGSLLRWKLKDGTGKCMDTDSDAFELCIPGETAQKIRFSQVGDAYRIKNEDKSLCLDADAGLMPGTAAFESCNSNDDGQLFYMEDIDNEDTRDFVIHTDDPSECLSSMNLTVGPCVDGLFTQTFRLHDNN